MNFFPMKRRDAFRTEVFCHGTAGPGVPLVRPSAAHTEFHWAEIEYDPLVAEKTKISAVKDADSARGKSDD